MPYRSEMLKKILFVVSTLALARAQIPSLGWCPEYVPMANFDMGKYLGIWYEVERYFQITEVVSRCVMANYTKGPDGKLRVSNEVTNRFTGVKRTLEGEIKASASKADEGKLHVKYTVPFTPETQYAVLDTDYKNYAVLWSCSGIGPINAQSAWLMTRERKPPGNILQKAYGVLDKYKISKTFFVKTDQDDCAYLESNPVTVKPAESIEQPAVEEATEEETVEEAQQAKNFVGFRSAIVPDAPAIIIETRKAELAEAAEKLAVETVKAEVQPEVPQIETKPEIQNAEPVEAVEENKEESNSAEKAVRVEVPQPASVPEVILKVADRAKEMVQESTENVKQFQPLEVIQEALANPVAQLQETFAKPVAQLQETFAKPVAQIQETFAKPAAQFQEVFAKPIAQIQQTFAAPLQNIQQTFSKPVEKIPEAIEKPMDDIKETVNKPVETIKETLNIPAVEATLVKLPEQIKEQEAAPKEEEKKEGEKKIES